MAERLHREFEEWLERLPRQEISPKFSRHLEECSKCKRRYHKIDPVATALNSLKDPARLSKKKLAELADTAKNVRASQRKKLLAWKVSLVCLVSLPFVALVNWLAATAGYGVLAYVSPALAKLFLISFCLTAVILTGVVYASVPIMIGWFQNRKIKEIAP